MSDRTRPRAPWYAPATRRLTLLRVGLPTLLACTIAIGPGVAISAASVMTKDVTVLVAHTTAAASAVLGAEHGHGHGHDGAADAHGDTR